MKCFLSQVSSVYDAYEGIQYRTSWKLYKKYPRISGEDVWNNKASHPLEKVNISMKIC